MYVPVDRPVGAITEFYITLSGRPAGKVRTCLRVRVCLGGRGGVCWVLAGPGSVLMAPP